MAEGGADGVAVAELLAGPREERVAELVRILRGGFRLPAGRGRCHNGGQIENPAAANQDGGLSHAR